jgi:hypothetical protein
MDNVLKIQRNNDLKERVDLYLPRKGGFVSYISTISEWFVEHIKDPCFKENSNMTSRPL